MARLSGLQCALLATVLLLSCASMCWSDSSAEEASIDVEGQLENTNLNYTAVNLFYSTCDARDDYYGMENDYSYGNSKGGYGGDSYGNSGYGGGHDSYSKGGDYPSDHSYHSSDDYSSSEHHHHHDDDGYMKLEGNSQDAASVDAKVLVLVSMCVWCGHETCCAVECCECMLAGIVLDVESCQPV